MGKLGQRFYRSQDCFLTHGRLEVSWRHVESQLIVIRVNYLAIFFILTLDISHSF